MAGSLINKDSVHFIGQASGFAVGPNLITNGDFETPGGGGAGSTTVFDNWINTAFNAGVIEVSDVDEDQLNGGTSGTTHACNIFTTGALTEITKAGILTSGKTYRVKFDVTAQSSGNILFFLGTNTNTLQAVSAVQTYVQYGVSNGASFGFKRNAGATNITIDNVEIVEWVGDPDAAGGITIAGLHALLAAGGDLTDIMTASGGVIHEDTGLATSNNGSNKVRITADSTWDKTPKVGTLVNVTFSAPLDSGEDSGIYEITAASTTTIDIDADFATPADNAITADVWIGGAFPDIATAIGDSTLSQDPDNIYRKRYIMVNVPMLVDESTIFVAETSETAHREDDGSRKIIGFYDSISVVSLKAGTYNVVSDMDRGQLYYAGARKAFNQDEGFSEINPNGKWVEWDAQGNDFGATGIIVLNSSNLEFRNLKIHNTIADAGTEGLLHTDTANFNVTFTNCCFDTSSLWQVNDLKSLGNSITDCYFGTGIDILSLSDWQQSVFMKCIFSGGTRDATIYQPSYCFFEFCLIYKGLKGVLPDPHTVFSNCLFFEQSASCVRIQTTLQNMGLYYNNIFSPLAASDIAIDVDNSSISPAGFNNIMYSVTAGAVLTNPIVHDQITPNPPLPVGTIQVDPQFVNPADGDFRLRPDSPGLNAGYGGGSIGMWPPYALPVQGRRARYAGTPIYR